MTTISNMNIKWIDWSIVYSFTFNESYVIHIQNVNKYNNIKTTYIDLRGIGLVTTTGRKVV